jgi:hypothetical protein
MITLKELFEARVALEHVVNATLPAEQAALLSENAKVLWSALRSYFETRQRVWREMGLHEQPCAACMKIRAMFFARRMAENKEKREAPFYAQMETLELGTTIHLPRDPVPYSMLPNLKISTVDLLVMQSIGFIGHG